MSNEALEIRFGGEQDGYLSIRMRGRAYRQSTDFWDGNWLLVDFVFQVGKFSGTIPGTLRAEELEDFNTKLQALYKSLSGTVSYTTLEGWIMLKFEADRTGHIQITGWVKDNIIDTPNVLTFAGIGIDQTFLNESLKQLQLILKEFPVVGERR